MRRQEPFAGSDMLQARTDTARGQDPSDGSDILHALSKAICLQNIISCADRSHPLAVTYYVGSKFVDSSNRLQNLHHTRTRSNLCGQKKSADLHAHCPKQSLKAFRQQSREEDWFIPSGDGKWMDILVQSSRNSKWLALSARESERFCALLLPQSELGSPHAVVVAANTLNLIGRSQFLPVSWSVLIYILKDNT